MSGSPIRSKRSITSPVPEGAEAPAACATSCGTPQEGFIWSPQSCCLVTQDSPAHLQPAQRPAAQTGSHAGAPVRNDFRRRPERERACWRNAGKSSAGRLVVILRSKTGVQSGRGWSPVCEGRREGHIATLPVRCKGAEETFGPGARLQEVWSHHHS